MDFRLKCKGCEHQVMVARKLVEKNFKGFVENQIVNFKSCKKKDLLLIDGYDKITNCDMQFIPCSFGKKGPETKRRCR